MTARACRAYVPPGANASAEPDTPLDQWEPPHRGSRHPNLANLANPNPNPNPNLWESPHRGSRSSSTKPYNNPNNLKT
eukprot:scaffold21353_cov55-Phaeocystis_antarctica.AAC.5